MTTAARKPIFSSGCHFDILICLGLVLAVFVPYHQVAAHRFIEFDDGVYAFQNTYIIKGLCWDSICWAFTNTDSANWQPLTWISHFVDREIFGPHPGGYLLENVAWHALASCLCYLAFYKTTGRRLFAFTVALFFAVHPTNVENVAWASERKSLLDAVFWFAAIISYLDFIETRSFRSYGVTVIAHILGLLSKAMSITLPCTLVLIHVLYLVYHPDRRDPGSRPRHYVKGMLLPVVPLLALSAYFTLVTISAQSMAMPGTSLYSPGLRLINVLRSYYRYIEMFFHPGELANFYPLFQNELTFRSAIPAIVALSAITIAVCLLVRRKPQLLIGWCWYLGTMVPVIGLVQVGSQSHADRYLYIPMLGLAFLYPVLFEELCSIGALWRRAVAGVSLAILAVSMIAATQIQVSYWKDGVTLFRHSLSVTGNCVTSVMSLAAAYSRTGRYPEMIAFADSQIATATNPDNKAKLSFFKASGLYNMQKYEAAIASAQKALDWGDTSEVVYFILAASNYQMGNKEKAAQYLAKAKTVHKPVNRTSLVEVEREDYTARLELLVKETAAPNENHDSQAPAAAGSSVSGTKN